MSDDELERLRAADPVDRASVPSATDPGARALFERITMSHADVAEPEARTASHVKARRRRTVLMAAAGVVAIVAIGGVVAVAGGSDSEPDTVATDATTTTTSGGPITPGGPIGSCVETYDLETLLHREMAFDGTVQRVEGDKITLSVNQWYRGGDADEITLGGAEVVGGMTSAGPGAALAPGTRLLVAGDGGFAWSCGFTQPYDRDVATAWAAAFAE